jgi:hypothetical protein
MAHSQIRKPNQLREKKGVFLVLWILCVFGSWSLLPYVQYLNIVPSDVSFAKMFLLATVQSIIFFGIICWLSYLLVPKTDLFPFAVDCTTTMTMAPRRHPDGTLDHLPATKPMPPRSPTDDNQLGT